MARPVDALSFPSRLRSARLTSQLGLALFVAFAVCFVTGYLSHAIQQPPSWFAWPSRPVNLYRVTQGLHVATGIAMIPLLAAKLWSVYPRLFTWPPLRGVGHALERLSVAVLVAAAIFQLVTGLLNIARWYDPMPFFFVAAHYWTAWLVTGALLVHVGVKLPVVRSALARVDDAIAGAGLTRRQLLTGVAATAGLVTVATAGQTVAPLAPLSVLAPRDPRRGPQGLPVNRSAVAAGVLSTARDPAYRLVVVGRSRTVELSLADLAAMPQYDAELPIACVEGWSATGRWSGVRLRDLVSAVGGGTTVRVESLERVGRYGSSTVVGAHVRDSLTLLALRLDGEPLHIDHGYPCRLIAPNRPGVLQTKWISRVVVT